MEVKTKTYSFTIGERVVYWQRGTIRVEAKSKQEAVRMALDGDYEHEGDNEVDPNSEGPILSREVYSLGEMEKPIKDKTFGVAFGEKEREKLLLLLRCAEADLSGLLKETETGEEPHPGYRTLAEIKEFINNHL